MTIKLPMCYKTACIKRKHFVSCIFFSKTRTLQYNSFVKNTWLHFTLLVDLAKVISEPLLLLGMETSMPRTA